MAQRKTERKKKDRAPAASDRGDGRRGEEQLRLLSRAVEQGPNVVVISDARGNIEYVNPGFTAITGYAPEEVIGKQARDFGEQSPEWEKRLWESLASGREWRGEFESKRKNGEVYWLSASISPIKSPDGVTTHFLGCGEDITERKRAEEALRESEEKYRDLVENVNDVIYEVDATGRITYISSAVTATGYSPSDIIGRNFSEFLHPDDLSAVGESFRRGLAGIRETNDYRLWSKSGEILWVRSDGQPIFDGDRIVGFRGVLTDITDRKRAEEALRESEEKWRSLTENAPDFVITVDSDGKVLATNRTIVGFSAAEVVGNTIYAYIAEEYHSGVRQALGDAFQNREVGRIEIAGVGPSGTTSWYEVRLGPIVLDGRVAAATWIARDITERKRVEEALRESEERFRSAFEHAATGMALVAPNGRLLQVNRSCCEALGYSEEELTSMTWQAVTHPDDLETTQQHVRRVLAGESDSFQFEKRFTHKLGHVLWGHTTSSLLRDADGKPVHFITQIQDVTERKGAEQALRESEERYRDLVENLNDVIYAVDESGRITYISPVIEQLSGYSPAEAIGRSFAEFVHPEDMPPLTESFRRNLSGNPEPNEYRVLAKSGEVRWVRTFSRPILEGDHVIGLRGVLTDITERKRMEAALGESEDRYRRLVELSPDTIAVHSEGEIVFINAAGVKLLGAATAEEVIGRPIWDLVHPDYHAIVEARVRRLQEGKKLDPVEEKLIRFDGEVIDVEIVGTAITYQGKPAGQVVVRDISERKRMEVALQQAREDLETKVESLMQRASAYCLTFRELTVLHLVAAGRADKEIGAILGISSRTANKHVENILNKMNASSRTEAGVRAVREGLLD